jgi:hypothetical protein
MRHQTKKHLKRAIPVQKIPVTSKTVGIASEPTANLNIKQPPIVDQNKPTLELPTTIQPPATGTPTPPIKDLLQCAAPDSRTPPAFEIAYRRPISLMEAGDSIFSPALLYPELSKEVPLSGSTYTLSGVFFGVDVRFLQVWNMTGISIGDLGTTISLAPQEQLTVEVQTSQRKTFDQTTMDSTDSMSSTESTNSDKEAVNVARSSTKTEGWHVDGSASIAVGDAKAQVSAGYSKNITDSNQQTINHVSEATTKSAKNLKMLHSITVKGVTETIVQNRMTRILKNPYVDRTMTINVFQLLKTFSTTTSISETRGALVVQINSVEFNDKFVQSHVAFLQNYLLDGTMIDDLPNAIAGSMPAVLTGALDTAVQMSKMALNYLFDLDGDTKLSPSNILNLAKQLPIDVTIGGVTVTTPDQNDPVESFKLHTAVSSGVDGGLSVGDIVLGVLTGGASLTAEALQKAYDDFLKSEKSMRWSSGFDTSVRTKSSALFMTLAFFNAIARETVRENEADRNSPEIPILEKSDNSIAIAMALAADLSAQWSVLYPDPIKSDELHAMMSSRNYTEVFRRVPGFLAMMNQLVRPLVEPAAADSAAIAAHNQNVFSFNRLTNHLNSYSDFYTTKYLGYISAVTNGDAIAQFARGILNHVVFPFKFDPADFDPDGAFLSKRDVIVPGVGTLSDNDLITIARSLGIDEPGTIVAPVPALIDIEVPCDGVHMEVVPGTCVMPDVPAQSSFPAVLNGLSLAIK